MAVNIMTNTMMMTSSPGTVSSNLPSQICSPLTSAQEDSLICDEILDLNELNKTPENTRRRSGQTPLSVMMDSFSAESLPPTVMAVSDPSQLNDSRVLQNLLKNEHRFAPTVPDFMRTVQRGEILPEHRKLVADWMLGIIHEKQSQPEVFCVAINLMDRFLCTCQIRKSQLQLLGAVCILVASKVREPRAIPGSDLIKYTDDSITADELKEWELLVLYKLHWELSSITPIDYLDQAIPRLGLNEEVVDLIDLRRRVQTILVLAITEYQFAYHPPSLLAASAIITAIQSLSTPNKNTPDPNSQAPTKGTAVPAAADQEPHPMEDGTLELQTILANPQKDDVMRELQLRLQIVTHTATAEVEKCTTALTVILPELLKGISDQFLPIEHPDSAYTQTEAPVTPPVVPNEALEVENEDDLTCTEALADQENSPPPAPSEGLYTLRHHHSPPDSSPNTSISQTSSRSSSPLSAVDIFTEYNSNVLRAIFDQVEQHEPFKTAPQVPPTPSPEPLKPASNEQTDTNQTDILVS